MNVSSHWIRSPLLSLNKTRHHLPEDHLRDALRAAQVAGTTSKQLAPAFDLQRQGIRPLDFVRSENSRGIQANQEAARILGKSIGDCR